MSAIANGLPQNPDIVMPDKQTVELRSGDGSADIHLMLAGLVTAARIGFELPDALEIAKKTYVDVNIHDAKNAAILNSLAQLPTSCAESADELEKNRALYEAKGVFSKSMIDGRIAMLRAYNDANIREEVKRDKGLMMELVRRYYHCG
jgi:glutamine synthetase